VRAVTETDVLTRDTATRLLRGLTSGLGVDDAGVRRLLERVAGSGHAEALRDLLAEEGARRVLEDAAITKYRVLTD